MDGHDPEYLAAREKLAEAIREYDRTVSDDPRIVIASTVVYEVSLFDDVHDQVYSLQHAVLDGSLCSAAGMLEAAKWRLNRFINDSREGPYSLGEDDD